uniref:Uncharacterized protein n=1 Tax=Pyxicephalus adspersus TaxID=30357 RepID=A0AAV3A8V4_PYXAD|nr:TPA: hypothetical protein GDO54_008115 [Pyxicephalus adspersus]
MFITPIDMNPPIAHFSSNRNSQTIYILLTQVSSKETIGKRPHTAPNISLFSVSRGLVGISSTRGGFGTFCAALYKLEFPMEIQLLSIL